MGFPLVTVNQSNGVLTQTRFFAVTPEDQNSIPPSPYKYVIIINLVAESKSILEIDKEAKIFSEKEKGFSDGPIILHLLEKQGKKRIAITHLSPIPLPILSPIPLPILSPIPFVEFRDGMGLRMGNGMC